MIHQSVLGALADYYDRRLAEKVPLGFERKEIPFVIVLDKRGRFVGLDDLRKIDGKKKSAPTFLVPQGAKRASGIRANILWDNPGYLFGRPKPDPKKDAVKEAIRALKLRDATLARFTKEFSDPSFDEGISAVSVFLQADDFTALYDHPSWREVEETGANLSFRLNSDACLISERPVVFEALKGVLGGRDMVDEDDERTEVKGEEICLVTGKTGPIAILHPAIKNIWGGQTSGSNIVSFNLPAFCSIGKGQGANAPVGKRAVFAYTTALNHLLAKGSKHRFQVGDASTVFWAERDHEVESWMADLFGKADGEPVSEDTTTVTGVFAAPRHGTSTPSSEDLTPFYVLGLSPNAARAAVRIWHPGTVGEVVRNIEAHFADTTIVHGSKDTDRLPLFRLLSSTALQGKSENIPPNVAGDTMKSILEGTTYPWTLLAAAIRRVRAERSVPYARASVIKAVLGRKARLKNPSEKEVGMALDESNLNTGYRLGRLFAVLERAQSLASPGINATIRDRFYGGASSTPVAVFPHLMKLKNHHLAKLENVGARVNLEKMIGTILDGVFDFPAHLDLADQGRFAIGYYHQAQEFFRKKTNDEPTAKETAE